MTLKMAVCICMKQKSTSAWCDTRNLKVMLVADTWMSRWIYSAAMKNGEKLIDQSESSIPERHALCKSEVEKQGSLGIRPNLDVSSLLGKSFTKGNK